MTDILRGVLKEGGTAAGMHWYEYTSEPAAGKTGTTNSSTDGWFCGFTDDFSAAVWIGNDDSTPVDGLYGGTHPAEIWRDTMLKMIEIRAKEDEEKFYKDSDNETDESEHEKKEKAKKDDSEETKPHTTKMYAIVDSNVRTEPDPDSEIHTSIESGSAVDVIKYDEHWSEVWVDDGKYYIYSPLLTSRD
jgi:membrane peptidoglycan carboxypeptidase